MSMIFDRYKDVPGVLGFDAINEDFSFPPEVHDKLFMKEAHELLLARLRAVDSRHIYFQQPAGWDSALTCRFRWDIPFLTRIGFSEPNGLRCRTRNFVCRKCWTGRKKRIHHFVYAKPGFGILSTGVRV